MNKKVILSLLAVVLAIGAASWFFKKDETTNTTTIPLHTVARGDLVISVAESGQLEAQKSTPVICEADGKSSLIISLVEEGVIVKKGDLLVELDSSDLQTKISQQESQVGSAISSWNEAKENLEIRKSLNLTEVTKAKLDLEFARLELNKFLEAGRPLELRQQTTKITLAQDELARAKAKLWWTKKLQEKGYATKDQLDADSLNVKRQELNLDQEKAKETLMKKYDHPQKLTKLKADIEKAEQELERVKRGSVAKLSQSQSTLQAKELSMKNAKAELEQMKVQLGKMKIFAPEAGLVIYHKERYWRPAELALGASVRKNQRLIDLPDMEKLTAKVKVHESRVNQLTIGQTAYISLDIYPDKRFKGSVQKVAVMPNNDYWGGGKTYTTEIVVDEALPGDVKPGLSANAEIMIGTQKDVLLAPVQTIVSQNGIYACYVKRGRTFESVHIEMGKHNDLNVEIKSGLKEGDILMLDPPTLEEAESLGYATISEEEAGKLKEAAEAKKPKSNPLMKKSRSTSSGSGGKRMPGRRPKRKKM